MSGGKEAGAFGRASASLTWPEEDEDLPPLLLSVRLSFLVIVIIAHSERSRTIVKEGSGVGEVGGGCRMATSCIFVRKN